MREAHRPHRPRRALRVVGRPELPPDRRGHRQLAASRAGALLPADGARAGRVAHDDEANDDLLCSRHRAQRAANEETLAEVRPGARSRSRARGNESRQRLTAVKILRRELRDDGQLHGLGGLAAAVPQRGDIRDSLSPSGICRRDVQPDGDVGAGRAAGHGERRATTLCHTRRKRRRCEPHAQDSRPPTRVPQQPASSHPRQANHPRARLPSQPAGRAAVLGAR